MPWGPNSKLQLVRTPTTAGGCSREGFFDAACVDYPTTYSYPDKYDTRALVALNPPWSYSS